MPEREREGGYIYLLDLCQIGTLCSLVFILIESEIKDFKG